MNKKSFFQSEFWKMYGGATIAIVLALLVFFAGLILKSVWTSQLSDMRVNVIAEQNDKVIQQGGESALPAVDEKENTVRVNLTGCDMNRKNRDDKMMADFLSYGVTWSNSEEYTAQRNKLMSKYAWLSADSEYLSKFFPDPSGLIIRDHSGADMFNPLDDGRNTRFTGLYTHVVDVKDGVYSYVGDLRTQSSGLVGGTATGKIIVTYDTTETGEVENLHFYIVSM